MTPVSAHPNTRPQGTIMSALLVSSANCAGLPDTKRDGIGYTIQRILIMTYGKVFVC